MATFPTVTPGSTSTEGSYFMAMRFSVSSTQTVTGIRFYSPGTQAGAGVGLYAEGGAGAGLATKMQAFTSGWNEVTFTSPVTVSSGTNYVAGVLLPATAGYSAVAQADVTEGAFTSAHIGAFISPAPASLTFTVAPHWLGSADDGRLDDSGTSTWYGIQVVFDVSLDQLAFTATKATSTTVDIDWDDTDTSITNGVTIARGPGTLSADGSGDNPGDTGYDPTTISGVTVVASAQTTSPYTDTVPSAGTYTYWIARTAN